MAAVILDRVWLQLASDPAQALQLLMDGNGRDFPDAIQGEIRSYAGGRQRLVTTATRRRGVNLQVGVNPTQYQTLNDWAGQLVLYRDGHGTKLWGAFLETPWKPLLDGLGTAWRSVSLSIAEVSYSEAV